MKKIIFKRRLGCSTWISHVQNSPDGYYDTVDGERHVLIVEIVVDLCQNVGECAIIIPLLPEALRSPFVCVVLSKGVGA